MTADRLAGIRAEHERFHRPAGKITMRREGCEVCYLLDLLMEYRVEDPDYHPRFQDEYQRLWHRDSRAGGQA